MNPIYQQMNRTGLDRLKLGLENFQRTFRGDPRAEVERMLQSGQMSQQQFNELAQQANRIAEMLGMKQG